MKLLIDTDVLLDVALGREPHVRASAGVLKWVEAGGKAAVASHSIANCAYLLKNARPFLRGLLQLVDVAPVGKHESQRALDLPMTDLEDALQVAAAESWGADLVVTRNLRDYRRSPVKAISPDEFLKKFH
jgi:predicted nucleic acid-binding protein